MKEYFAGDALPFAMQPVLSLHVDNGADKPTLNFVRPPDLIPQYFVGRLFHSEAMQFMFCQPPAKDKTTKSATLQDLAQAYDY